MPGSAQIKGLGAGAKGGQEERNAGAGAGCAGSTGHARGVAW